MTSRVRYKRETVERVTVTNPPGFDDLELYLRPGTKLTSRLDGEYLALYEPGNRRPLAVINRRPDDI